MGQARPTEVGPPPPSLSVVKSAAATRALRWRVWRRHPIRTVLRVAAWVVLVAVFPVGLLLASGDDALPRPAAAALAFAVVAVLLYAFAADVRAYLQTPRRLVIAGRVIRLPQRVHLNHIQSLQLRRLGPTGAVLKLRTDVARVNPRPLFVRADTDLAPITHAIDRMTPPRLAHLHESTHTPSMLDQPERPMTFAVPWRWHLASVDHAHNLSASLAIMQHAASLLAIILIAGLIAVAPSPSVYLQHLSEHALLIAAAVLVIACAPWLLSPLGRWKVLSHRGAHWHCLQVCRRCSGGRHVLCSRLWSMCPEGAVVRRQAIPLPASVDLAHLDAWIAYINAESARKRRAYGWERTS